MNIHITNTQDDGVFGVAKIVVIKSFKQVTIFGDTYTKIVYMHSPTSFTIEKINDDDNVQVVDGPRAEEIITEMINHEKQKHSTFIWTGAHFEHPSDVNIRKSYRSYPDPLIRDPIQTESERKVKKE